MPLVLEEGVNSWASLAEAELYFEGRVNSTPWTGALNKEELLYSAWQRLEQERYAGRKTDALQLTKFPRTGLVDGDGSAVDPDEIPQNAKWAQFEQALYMASLGTTDASLPTGLEPFKVLKTTTVTMEMRDRTPAELSGLAPAAIRLLGDWLITYDEAAGDLHPSTFRIRRV